MSVEAKKTRPNSKIESWCIRSIINFDFRGDSITATMLRNSISLRNTIGDNHRFERTEPWRLESLSRLHQPRADSQVERPFPSKKLQELTYELQLPPIGGFVVTGQ